MRVLRMLGTLLLCATVAGCMNQAHPPVFPQMCTFSTEAGAGGQYVVRYTLGLKNDSAKVVAAIRVVFANWSQPGESIYDYKMPMPPGLSTRVSLSTSPFRLTAKPTDRQKTPPPRQALMACKVVAVRFNDGTIWTDAPGTGSP